MNPARREESIYVIDESHGLQEFPLSLEQTRLITIFVFVFRGPSDQMLTTPSFSESLSSMPLPSMLASLLSEIPWLLHKPTSLIPPHVYEKYCCHLPQKAPLMVILKHSWTTDMESVHVITGLHRLLRMRE
jgi:hypothetical protein